MFDMIDVIQMSKISKHYLLEYQTLLDSYEMQASNVTSGFRVLDFSDDISDVDYTSDDWSFNESYSETSGEMTNSVQAKLLTNPPEYSVCAGSKPLSIIIRRCNTPTAVCSSPVQKVEEQSSCFTGSTLSPVHCGVNSLFICPKFENTESKIADKDIESCASGLTDTSILCNNKNELQEENAGEFSGHSEAETKINGRFETEEEFNACLETKREFNGHSKAKGEFIGISDTLIKNFRKDFSNICQERESYSERNNASNLQGQNQSSSCSQNGSLAVVDLLPCIGAKFTENINNPAPALTECSKDSVPKSKIKNVDSDLHHSISENSGISEFHSSLVISNKCSDYIQNPVINISKLPALSDEINKELSVCESNLDITCGRKQDKWSVDAADNEVNFLTSTLHDECSNPLTERNDVIEYCGASQSAMSTTDDSLLPPLEDINSWRHLSCSPLLFSSDDESSSIADEVSRGIEAALAPSPQRYSLIENEKRRVSKLQELLMGAPPPPAVTTPLFTSSEILQALKDRAPWVTVGSANVCMSKVSTQLPQDVLYATWPLMKHIEHPGIHYNHGTVSEQFESLCQKLLVRCVGSETASSVTVWSSFTLPAPRKERRLLPSRRGPGAPTGLSPGRRLSHLARRHRTFSSAALLMDGARLHSALPHAVPERRTIMVEGRKKERGRKSRSSQKKQRGSGCATTAAVDAARDAAKLRSSKRALFQSPNEEDKKKKKTGAAGGGKFRPSSASAVRSRRALFACDQPSSSSSLAHSFSAASTSSASTSVVPVAVVAAAAAAASGRKRKRADSEEEDDDDVCQRLPRRRLFGDESAAASCRPISNNISSAHRKKLLWAVAEALKKRGIGLTHSHFRACASILGAKCRGHVAQMLAEREGSTSDRLLQLTLRFVDEAIGQHKGLSQTKRNGHNDVG